MADSVLFIGWNRARPGKEKDALEAFSSALAYFGKQAAAGQIESVEPVILDLHGGDLNGFLLIKGSGPKLAALRASDEFRDLMVKADMAVGGLGTIDGFCGEGVTREIGRFQRSIG